MALTEEQYFAEMYDSFVHDWDGELDFYRELAAPLASTGGSLLELGCGTGRVAIRLAHMGMRVVGLDLSPEMIAVARAKSAGMGNIRWEVGDMRNFVLGETFDLVIIPGHAFQFMLSAEAQLECLASIRQHMNPAATLVLHLDHQDVHWLGGLPGEIGENFEQAGEFTHPQTGRQVRQWRAWSYERSTQTATMLARWDERDEAGQVTRSGKRGPIRLHCAFRFEMEHLLQRAGFEALAIFGDFLKCPLTDNSSEMIWLASVRA